MLVAQVTESHGDALWKEGVEREFLLQMVLWHVEYHTILGWSGQCKGLKWL